MGRRKALPPLGGVTPEDRELWLRCYTAAITGILMTQAAEPDKEWSRTGPRT